MRKQIAGYEIVGELGHGGMATVYRARVAARSAEERDDVAIKVLRREYLTDLGFRARFEREGAVISGLKHVAIVPVYEFGQFEEQLYIVMAYMPHGTLAQRLDHGPLPLETTTGILTRIAAALDYAHSQGVSHRDLKTSNILFDTADLAYLADFGIARQSQTDEPGIGVPGGTQPGGTQPVSSAISGTPAYMSPEQARRETVVSGASDIYALGVTAFQLLTGRLPFNGETPVAILMQHIHEASPAPHEVNPELPASLAPLLRKALAKNPESRYKTGTAFVTAVRQALEGDADSQARAMAAVVTPEAAVAALMAAIRPAAVVDDAQGGPTLPAPAAGEEAEGAWPERLRRKIEPRWQALQRRLAANPAHAFLLVTLLAILCAFLAVIPLRGPALVAALRTESPAEAQDQTAAQGQITGQELIVASDATSPASMYLPFVPLERGLVTPTVTPAPTPVENVRLLYSESVVTLINISGGHVSLTHLALRRVSSDGSFSPSFEAGEWRRVAGSAVTALPPGDCLQLLRTDAAAAGGPQKPSECDTLRGWLATRGTDPFFQGLKEDDVLHVLHSDEQLQSCPVAARSCQFFLALP